jgi:hypothetical protein
MRGIDWVRQRLNWSAARAEDQRQETKPMLVDVEETVTCKKFGGDRIGSPG